MAAFNPRTNGALLCALLLEPFVAEATGDYLKWDVYSAAGCADADIIHSEILGKVGKKDLDAIVADDYEHNTRLFSKSGDNYIAETHYDSLAGSFFSFEPSELGVGPTACTKGDDASLDDPFDPLDDYTWGKVSLVEKPGYTLYLEFYASTDTDCSGEMSYSAHEYFLSGCQQDYESWWSANGVPGNAYKFGIENDTFVKREWYDGTSDGTTKSNCSVGNGTLISGVPFTSGHIGARHDGLPWTCGEKCTKFEGSWSLSPDKYYKAKCVEGAYDGNPGADVGYGSRAHVHAGVVMSLAAWAVGWAAGGSQ